MSEQPASCRIVLDRDKSVFRYVCDGLGFTDDWINACLTLGFVAGDKLIGGLIYHNMRPNHDLWWTIYTTDKRWCTKAVLKQIFGLAFNYYNVQCVRLLINTDNAPCLKLVERLGFKREGLLRCFREDAADCFVYSILKSENLWKGKKSMSKSIGKILGAGGATTGNYGSETNLLNYLKNYNTANYDTTLNNLTSYAANASANLNNMGSYNFGVSASDDARQRAETAQFNAYTNMLSPQFANQTDDLQARLLNQGLSVGNPAYQRAMTDLQNNQNSALTNAAYQAVEAGQNAYSQSLNDQISAAGFTNSAQSGYINQLLSALQNSVSGYNNAMNIYSVQHPADSRIAQNSYANSQARQQTGDDFLRTAATAALSAFSDARLKENIFPVGKLFNGLTVYRFNFKGCPFPQIGLIAQEVCQHYPEAVTVDKDGFLKVDYNLACRTKEN
ncbi:MAG: hypothetical protein IJ529_00165 [Alphaproteobacteria bacterium]|nr:hypothetical protein [Alphaproteobacteria bacterium]MBQ9235121.1 hypothetical protein [Alphaproteobacteria bacterium]